MLIIRAMKQPLWIFFSNFFPFLFYFFFFTTLMNLIALSTPCGSRFLFNNGSRSTLTVTRTFSNYLTSRLANSLLNSLTMRSYTLLVLSWQFACLVSGSKVKDISSAVTRQIRSLGFPKGSGMGIFFAIGIPLDIPDKAVSLSFYFEANYLLPDPAAIFENEFGDIFGGRAINRSLAYQIIETKLDGAGYKGRSCLLRSICEAKENSVRNNGLVGDIIHILLTPSTSMNENLPSEITNAENAEDCSVSYSDCSISLLGLISKKETEQ